MNGIAFRSSAVIASVLAPLLLTASAHALGCGDRLVVDRSVCGEPTSMSVRTESRTR